jgi:ATP-dependent Zn protease
MLSTMRIAPTVASTMRVKGAVKMETQMSGRCRATMRTTPMMRMTRGWVVRDVARNKAVVRAIVDADKTSTAGGKRRVEDEDANASEKRTVGADAPVEGADARGGNETGDAGEDEFGPVERKPFSLWRWVVTRTLLVALVARRATSMLLWFIFGGVLRTLGATMRHGVGRIMFFTLLTAATGIGYKITTMRKAKTPPPPTAMYSAFLKDLKQGKITSVRFEEGSTRLLYDVKLDGKAKAKAADGAAAAAAAADVKTYQTKRLVGDMELMKKLENAGVEFGAVPPAVSRLASRGVFTMLAMWLPIIPLMIFMRNAINRQSGGGKKRKKAAPVDEANRVTFKDVAGVEEAKAELFELVQIMKNADQYKNVRGRLPTGCLLVGPPGTGKTLLARAVAGESGVAFFPVAASEFVELFVGRGAARVRELFAEARKTRPAIIFIDELDAVGSRRGAGLNEERDQTLNQLLVEMDGFAKDSGILILAATNRPDALDPALLRPGRLTRRVFVGPPSQQGRAQILGVHLRDIDLDEDIDVVCDVVSRATPGFTGAELANVCNEAALLSVRDGRELVSVEDLLSGVSRTKDGIATSSNKADAMFRELRSRFLGNYKDLPGSTANDLKDKFGPRGGNGVPISMGPS